MREVKTTLDAIMLLEGGDPTKEEAIAAMQLLVDTGVVWQLQGSYGRLAKAMIDAGDVKFTQHA